MDISTRQLRAFVLVYRLQSITKAADRLYLTQAAVSSLIKQLETALQVRLFDRTTRFVSPTPFAKQIFTAAEAALGEVSSIQRSAKNAIARSRGVVRFTASPAACSSFIPIVMREFMQNHPDVAVELKEIAIERLIDCVVNDEVDFSIGTPIETPPEVHLLPLVTDVVAAICRRDSKIVSFKHLEWNDIAAFPLMTMLPGMGIRKLIDTTLDKVGIPFEPTYEYRSLATMLSLAAEGIGTLIAPSRSIPKVFRKILVARKLHGPTISRTTYVITKRADSLSPPAEALVKQIREHLLHDPSPV